MKISNVELVESTLVQLYTALQDAIKMKEPLMIDSLSAAIQRLISR